MFPPGTKRDPRRWWGSVFTKGRRDPRQPTTCRLGTVGIRSGQVLSGSESPKAKVLDRSGMSRDGTRCFTGKSPKKLALTLGTGLTGRDPSGPSRPTPLPQGARGKDGTGHVVSPRKARRNWPSPRRSPIRRAGRRGGTNGTGLEWDGTRLIGSKVQKSNIEARDPDFGPPGLWTNCGTGLIGMRLGRRSKTFTAKARRHQGNAERIAKSDLRAFVSLW